MKTLICLIFMATVGLLQAQVPDLDWVQSGAMGPSQMRAYDNVLHMQDGGVLYQFRFDGTVDANPGPPVENVVNAAIGDDLLLIRLDQVGNKLWHRHVFGSLDVIPRAIDEDANGNIYVAGTFSGVVDFDPGAGTASYTGTQDAFLLKLNASGDFVWARTFGTPLGLEQATGVGADAQGNVLLTGSFDATTDFDPGSGTFNLVPVPPTFGQQRPDLFVVKLDASGNFVWAFACGDAEYDVALEMAVGANGEFAIAGQYAATPDMDPGSGVSLIPHGGGGGAIFIARYSSQGSLVWARGLRSTMTLFPFQVAMDGGGAVAVAGYVTGQVDLDPTAGVDNYQLNGTSGFSLMLDASGGYAWGEVLTLVDGLGSFNYTLDFDTQGNLYTGGFVFVFDSLDVDTGPDTAWVYADSASVGIIRKQTPTGDVAWVAAVTPTIAYGLSDVSCLSVGPTGVVYSGGFFTSTVDFNPGPFQQVLTAGGVQDFYYHRLEQVAVGIGEKARLVRVYPNPVQGLLRVDATDEVVSLKVLDLQGRELAAQPGDVLETRGLPAGIYLLVIQGMDWKHTTQVQVLH